MEPALLAVHYRLAGDAAGFRADMDKAATMIAAVPGLLWKLWGFDPGRGVGVSAYLFESISAAETFARGPIISHLRGRPDVAEVTLEFAPVDASLSALTGGASILGRTLPA